MSPLPSLPLLVLLPHPFCTTHTHSIHTVALPCAHTQVYVCALSHLHIYPSPINPSLLEEAQYPLSAAKPLKLLGPAHVA